MCVCVSQRQIKYNSGVDGIKESKCNNIGNIQGERKATGSLSDLDLYHTVCVCVFSFYCPYISIPYFLLLDFSHKYLITHRAR